MKTRFKAGEVFGTAAAHIQPVGRRARATMAQPYRRGSPSVVDVHWLRLVRD